MVWLARLLPSPAPRDVSVINALREWQQNKKRQKIAVSMDLFETGPNKNLSSFLVMRCVNLSYRLELSSASS